MTALSLLAVWASLTWTNPPQNIDSVRTVYVRAPGDTVALNLYETATVTPKRAGMPGTRDSARVSISTANVVGPAALRVHLFTHNSKGWSGPSNAVSLFYGARDTLYVQRPAWIWTQGVGLRGAAQEVGDSSFVSWSHDEVVQNENRAAICRAFGYVCRRGVRDTSWCGQP